MKLIMKKNLFVALSALAIVFCFKEVNAQNDTLKRNPSYRIAIFAPLYLDSVFYNNSFRYKQGIPRFIQPALEFVQGAQIALDSIPESNNDIEATIYDSKSFTQTVPWLIQHNKLDSLNFIIGSVKDAEYKLLADFALSKKIPFISATYPNDGGITANPYLVIVNPTLRSHCEAIYSYIIQNHGNDKIFLCRQKGNQENMISSYFKQLNEQDGKPFLDIQTINIEPNSPPDLLLAKLDSSRKHLVIGGSMDEAFAIKIAKNCAQWNSKYPITLVGMPTWDGFTSLHKKSALEDFPLFFTTPYYNTKGDENSKMLINAYNKRYKIKPTDMAYKGFEIVSLFIHILTKYPAGFMNHINDRSLNLFNEYNFRPVMLKKEKQTPDYFENKHLYFIQLLNGVISKAW